MSKTDITSRAGNFTSSSIWRLMTNDRKGTGIGAPGLSYIKEKRKEIRLGRQLQQEKNPRAASWGNFCEKIVFEKLPMSYIKNRKGNRKTHQTLPWSGEEDFTHEEYVGDFKAFELNNFCDVHDAATEGWEKLKEECPEVAWQLVSGSVLTGKPKGELILFVPYKSELELIIQEAKELDNRKYNWIAWTENEDELPYLIESDDCYYKNISHFYFDIPESDRSLLTSRVEAAAKMLII